MISERRQIAERFLSEGNGEAARIRGNRVRDLNKIQSEAYREVEGIRGVADAKATEIYAKAYNQSPEAAEFYQFTQDDAGQQVGHCGEYDRDPFDGQRPLQVPERHGPARTPALTAPGDAPRDPVQAQCAPHDGAKPAN